MSSDQIPGQARFSTLSRPAKGPTQPPILKELGVWVSFLELATDHSQQYDVEVKKRIQLYFYPLGIFMACSRVNFTLPLPKPKRTLFRKCLFTIQHVSE
jgi:hypothetical protein